MKYWRSKRLFAVKFITYRERCFSSSITRQRFKALIALYCVYCIESPTPTKRCPILLKLQITLRQCTKQFRVYPRAAWVCCSVTQQPPISLLACVTQFAIFYFAVFPQLKDRCRVQICKTVSKLKRHFDAFTFNEMNCRHTLPNRENKDCSPPGPLAVERSA